MLGADVVVVAQGPGNLGVGTPWGFSGVAAGEAVNAVAALGGRPVASLRLSDADPRERHRGISHHSRTAYGRVALAPADVVVPDAAAAPLAADVERDLAELGAPAPHRTGGRRRAGRRRCALAGPAVDDGPGLGRGPGLLPGRGRRRPATLPRWLRTDLDQVDDEDQRLVGPIGPLPCAPYPSAGGITISRRPPTFMPTMPWAKPGTTPLSGKSTGVVPWARPAAVELLAVGVVDPDVAHADGVGRSGAGAGAEDQVLGLQRRRRRRLALARPAA